MVHITKKKFEALPILIPKTTDLQKRIIAEIEKQFSRLDETVANLKRIKANLKRYKSSVLQAAVTGKLTEEWRKQNPDVEPASNLLERILIERRQKWEEAERPKMRAKGLPAPKDGVWWVYVILCDDNSYYVGASSDMPRRWSEHTGGKGAEWTKKHHPIRIIHHEKFCSQDDAFSREKELKTGFGRKWLKREFANDRLRQAGKDPKNDKWKEKYKEPVVPTEVNFELPCSWSIATIQQIAGMVQYGSSSKTNDNKDGVPVLRMGNIFEGQLIYDKLKYLPQDHDEFPALLLIDGDMLFNRTNSPELVGKTAVYSNRNETCSFASYLIRVRFLNNIEPKFIAFFINSIFGREWVKSVVNQQVGQANVNGTKLQNLTVPLPSSAEQKAIVQKIESRLTVAEEIERSVDTNLKRAERLRQSILKQAFSGKLV